MDTSRFDNMSVENAINSIKQKHFSDLDAVDYAFLASRKDYLSDADKAIYLEGKDPAEVLQEHTPLTREERTINENRPLQQSEKEIRQAQEEADRVLKEASLPKVGKAREEANEDLAEQREEKADSLAKEVKVGERVAKEKAAEDAKAAKAAAKEEKKGK